MAGNFCKRVDPSTCSVVDFYNPWNFYSLFLSPPRDVLEWMMRQGLIIDRKVCPHCQKDCRLVERKGKHHGFRWRCRKNEFHKDVEFSITENSFFRRTHFTFQDIMEFLRDLLLKNSLRSSSMQAGFDYKKTAVDWANFVRDLFREHVNDQYNLADPIKLSGEVEIDESLFGRRCKYHRGNPNVGVKVWVVGLVERATNKLVLYPVDNRTEDTLVHIIERHVEPGSTILTDGWAGYASLNDRGYDHFSVIHKDSFKARYKNTTTGDIKEVCTNRIEGAWKHAKDHFRKINGTTIANFEAHLAEVLWRNYVAGQNIFGAFFSLLRRCYPLTTPPNLRARSPLFDTWSIQQADIADTSLTRLSDGEDDEDDDDDGDISSVPSPTSTSTPHAVPVNRSTKRKKMSSRRVCCPADYAPVGERPGPSSSQVQNNYARDAYTWSDDSDDFE